jgi:TonB family protein
MNDQIKWAVGMMMAAVVACAADKPPEATVVEMGLPLILSWVPPVYPREAADKKLEGRVQLRVIIDETGAITKARAIHSTSRVFEEAAVESVRRWRFEPATDGGRKVAKCIDLMLPFRLADLKRKPASLNPPAEVVTSLAYSRQTPAVQRGSREADYPDSLLSRHLPGEVLIELAVNPEGKAEGFKILMATHADFVRPALNVMDQWTFRPAMQGDLPVAAPLKGSVEFLVIEPGRADVLAANAVTLAETPAGPEPPYDRKPAIALLADPIYPRELMLAGTGGRAVVDFVIGSNGLPTGITVREAARPDFGRALAAALECWIFRPARKDGAGVPVKASWAWDFNPAGDSVGPAVSRLADRLRGGDDAAMSARGLDARLNPRYQVSPVYPDALLAERVSGEATVEIIIDREGRGRLPRVVSASRAEFGWAAATAAAQWVFDPPKRGGNPVDVRVTIPFGFSPPPL